MEKPTTSKVDQLLDTLHALKTEGVLGEKLLEAVKETVISEAVPAELEDLLIKMMSNEKKVRKADRICVICLCGARKVS